MKPWQAVAACLASTNMVLGAGLQQVVNFGTNPTVMQMFVYVPDKIVANPAILVGVHSCQSSPQDLFLRDTHLVRAASAFGQFMLVYPGTSRRTDHCWDVNEAGSLTHDGLGDAVGIVSGIKYMVAKQGGDASRVFAYGSSTGMVSALAGAYPDVFAAAAVFSGVPFACQSGAAEPSLQAAAGNQSCARAELARTPDEWAAYVTNAYPKFNGSRPRMLVAQDVADKVVDPANGYASLAQWSTVLGVTNTKNVSDAQWTELVYGDGTKLVGYVGDGVRPEKSAVSSAMLNWFGLSS